MPNLDATLLHTVNTLAAAPLRTVEALHEAVAAHRSAIAKAAAASPFVDGDRAADVAKACVALLNAWPSLRDDQRRLVQAACLYFSTIDDGEGDIASIVGFEDDVEVVCHVAHAVGRPDLSLE